MKKSRESKMLNNVRRWCKKAYDADKAKHSSKRTKENEEIARKLNLPLIATLKTGSADQP
jgi:hypothetical protein